MKKVLKGINLKLSCYKCGCTYFENTPQNYNEIEGNTYLQDEKAKVKCVNCGLEDYVQNLVPKAEYNEELID